MFGHVDAACLERLLRLFLRLETPSCRAQKEAKKEDDAQGGDGAGVWGGRGAAKALH
jgi:hypothetical protein